MGELNNITLKPGDKRRWRVVLGLTGAQPLRPLSVRAALATEQKKFFKTNGTGGNLIWVSLASHSLNIYFLTPS